MKQSFLYIEGYTAAHSFKALYLAGFDSGVDRSRKKSIQGHHSIAPPAIFCKGKVICFAGDHGEQESAQISASFCKPRRGRNTALAQISDKTFGQL